jgi:hypothetical protein
MLNWSGPLALFGCINGAFGHTADVSIITCHHCAQIHKLSEVWGYYIGEMDICLSHHESPASAGRCEALNWKPQHDLLGNFMPLLILARWLLWS